jgi:hypothetical protein
MATMVLLVTRSLWRTGCPRGLLLSRGLYRPLLVVLSLSDNLPLNELVAPLLLIIALIDRLDISQTQQLRESLGVFVIGFVPALDQLVVARIADGHRRDLLFTGRLLAIGNLEFRNLRLLLRRRS